LKIGIIETVCIDCRYESKRGSEVDLSFDHRFRKHRISRSFVSSLRQGAITGSVLVVAWCQGVENVAYHGTRRI